jgi:Rrf2 family protein
MSEGVEWAAHCAVLLAVLAPEERLSAKRLAEYHGVPAPYLAKSLQALMREGIVDSTVGRRGGYRLARPATDISLLDIYYAIEGTDSSFQCSEIRRRGPSAVGAKWYPKPCGIAAVMWRAEEVWSHELASVSLAEIVGDVMVNASPVAIRKGSVWLTSVLAGEAHARAEGTASEA